jgi:UDP-N-acetylglucosamine acyltransferase
MPTNTIHPTALISPRATLGQNITIGPYTLIEADVTIGDHVTIESHTLIQSGTHIGDHVHIGPHATLGAPPQDLNFDPLTPTQAHIGPRTRIREGVTIHRATHPGTPTRIGAHCYLMAQSHVAHDCQLGDHVILANAVLLGGHVHIGNAAFLSGGAVIHQRTRVGPGAMISGNGRFSADIPPHTIAVERNHLAGLNLIGLRRRHTPAETMADLKRCYHTVYPKGKITNLTAAARTALDARLAQTDEGRRFLEFFTHAPQRPYIRPRRTSTDTDY